MKRYTGERVGFGLLLSVLALAIVLGGSVARADDLNLGGSFESFNFEVAGVNTSLGGGEVQNSFLNGSLLSFVYCVDLYDTVNVPNDYNNTVVTHDGTVTESAGAAGLGETGGKVNNAAEVAWLLDTYAVGAEGPAPNDAQIGLQAAIWTTIYGAKNGYVLASNNDAAAITDYNNDLAGLAAATGAGATSLANFDWFSPNSGNGVEQALIGGDNGSVPEPMSILLLGTVLLCLPKLRQKFIATRQS